MSDTPQDDSNLIEAAKADFITYQAKFEKRYGFGIGVEVQPTVTAEGFIQIKPTLTLVKIEQPVEPEAPVSTPDNADSTPEEVSASDSPKRDEAEAPE